MIGKLTSRAILASPLAQWGTYICPDTLEPERIKVVVNHFFERWEDSVTTRKTDISYASFPDHPLRRNAIITIGSQDYLITDVIADDGYLITSAVRKVEGC